MAKLITTGFIMLGLVLATIATPAFREYNTQLEKTEFEGRGFGSSLWGWITDPFGWWTPAATDATTAGAENIGTISESVAPVPPVAGIGDIGTVSEAVVPPPPAATAGTEDIGTVNEAVAPALPAVEVVEVHFGETPNEDNVNTTVWCNDQTCTTVRCSSGSCVRITCNIYDTNVHGECNSFVPSTIAEPSVSLQEHPIVVMPGQDDVSTQELQGLSEGSLKVIQLPVKESQKENKPKMAGSIKNDEVRVSNRL